VARVREWAVAAVGVALLGASMVMVAPPAGATATPLPAPAPAPVAGPAPVPAANSVDGFGSAAATTAAPAPSAPVVAIAPTAAGGGYWLASATGEVEAAGDAVTHGSLAGAPLVSPIVAMAADRATGGYWLLGGDGGIFSFGAPFFGSTGAMHLVAPVVGMAATPDGGGYWLVAGDGGIFTFGDAHFWGSTGAMQLNSPIVGMASTPDGGGYWLVAADGGIFTFGDAHFWGSTGAMTLDAPVVAMAATPDGGGYWLVAADGGIFTFGDALYQGSDGGKGGPLVVGIAAGSGGYWLAHGELSASDEGSVLRLQQLLASLGYLPLTWTPPGQQAGTPLDAELATVTPPSAGVFAWSWADPPPSLAALWQPGVATEMVTGAVMAFEAQSGLPMDGVASPALWAALIAAARHPATGTNTVGYTYALATKALPETLTVWHDAAIVDQAPANTGISVSPTPDGTWPVYSRLQSQIMTGINPDGSPYADPVQWVAYFNGGDAVHYIARGSYGYPQSLGCVEVSYQTGETVWPYLTYGSLVTVSG